MQTFIVRVYQPGQGSAPDDHGLRGVVEEISTGFQATFCDCGQLLSVLRRPGRETPVEPPRGALVQSKGVSDVEHEHG